MYNTRSPIASDALVFFTEALWNAPFAFTIDFSVKTFHWQHCQFEQRRPIASTAARTWRTPLHTQRCLLLSRAPNAFGYVTHGGFCVNVSRASKLLKIWSAKNRTRTQHLHTSLVNDKILANNSVCLRKRNAGVVEFSSQHLAGNSSDNLVEVTKNRFNPFEFEIIWIK